MIEDERGACVVMSLSFRNPGRNVRNLAKNDANLSRFQSAAAASPVCAVMGP